MKKMKMHVSLFYLLFFLVIKSFAQQGQFLNPEIWSGQFRGEEGANGYWNNHFADVNGDGKTDAIVVRNSGIIVRLSNGSSFLPEASWSTATYANRFADVNGDGKADLLVVNYYSATVRLSNGTSFGSAEIWRSEDPGSSGSDVQAIIMTDVNGDGKSDFVRNWLNGVFVSLSTGSSFNPPVNWVTGSDYEWCKAMVDVTGDGMADLIRHFIFNGSLTVWVRRSSGSSFLPQEVWFDKDPYYNIGVYGYYDVTGDGRCDMVLRKGVGDDRDAVVARSTGGAFESSPEAWTTNKRFIGFYSIQNDFADVTGDRKVDAIYVRDDAIVIQRAVTLAVSAPPGYSGAICGKTDPVTFVATPMECATDYQWTFPSGWGASPVSTGSTHFITLQPSGSPSDAGSVTVTVTSGCGNTLISSKTVNFASPFIASPAYVCTSGAAVTLQNTTSNTAVNWTLSANLALESGQGTRSITVGPVNSSADGGSVIRATTNCAGVSVPSKSLWTGKPVFQQFTYDGQMVPITCDGMYVPFTGGQHVITAVPGGTSSYPTFSLQTSSPYIQATRNGYNYNLSISTKNTNFEFIVRASVGNQCGTKQTCTYFTNWAAIASEPELYPNPSDAQTTIHLGKPGDSKKVSLYNSTLEQVFDKETTDETVTIDTSALPQGSYVLRITSDGKTNSRHLLVRH